MDAVDHVVLGAGAVGMAVAEALARRGESVRVVNRSGLRQLRAGVQSVAGDVTDPAFAASARAGARVVYQALNPPHHRWEPGFMWSGSPSSALRRGTAVADMSTTIAAGRSARGGNHRGVAAALRPTHNRGRSARAAAALAAKRHCAVSTRASVLSSSDLPTHGAAAAFG